MISSPGWVCLTSGASGPMSTRDWTISRPGALRSCRCRSVRHSPGACCTAPLGWLSSVAAHRHLPRELLTQMTVTPLPFPGITPFAPPQPGQGHAPARGAAPPAGPDDRAEADRLHAAQLRSPEPGLTWWRPRPTWPGVRRAGRSMAEPGADAGPAAPQAPHLIKYG